MGPWPGCLGLVGFRPDGAGQERSGRSRDTGGVGIGLALAQWAARANGGSLQLDDNAPSGCVFRLRLPLYQDVKTLNS